MSDYDLVVVGAGSAGLVAASIAARVDLDVALVEAAQVGGDCLWTGCVPSKTLVAAAKVAHDLRTAHRFGLPTTQAEPDLEAVWKHIRAATETIAASESVETFEDEGVDVLIGRAQLTGPGTLVVGTTQITTRFVLLSTGSRPAVPPIDGLAQVGFRTTDDFWDDAPKGPLLVVGGGATALEISQAVRRLGLDVIVVEALERVLPNEDPEHGEMIAAALESEGVEMVTGARLRAVEPHADGAYCTIDTDGGERRVHAAQILVAAGRAPNIEGLGLDDAGVEHDSSGVRVDDRLRTNVTRVYAAGDVAGRHGFTHSAAYEGAIAVRNMFLPFSMAADAAIPRCTFTDPQLAAVGLTESEAKQRHGDKVRVRRMARPLDDRAVTDGATVDIKIIEVEGKIRGASIIGPAAAELINEITLVIDKGLGTEALGTAVHVYPSFGTSLHAMGGEAAFERVHRYRWLINRRR